MFSVGKDSLSKLVSFAIIRHYVVKGPEQTPYEGGFYHGKLIFPVEYPFQPPSIYMSTPNGRFKVNKKLCLSISDFHPDTWNPAWNVSTILIGLLSFMIEQSPTWGSIITTDHEKKLLAVQSLEYNLMDKMFCELFPETVEVIKAELKHRKELEKQGRHMSMTSEVSYLIQDQLQREQSTLHRVLTNVFVIVGFVVFAFVVKYVLRGITME